MLAGLPRLLSRLAAVEKFQAARCRRHTGAIAATGMAVEPLLGALLNLVHEMQCMVG